jgi:hypothetical protein
MIYLNDIWCVYFHDPYDFNWNIKSYHMITQISSVEDFIDVYRTFFDLFQNGMFFIMREHITPRWEDENNKNGGCISFKIPKTEMKEKLFETCCKCLGETMGKNKDFSMNINGISICPKRNYHIIRLWLRDNKYSSSENYNICVPKFSTMLYKNHYNDS